jgi:hypothetical protein
MSSAAAATSAATVTADDRKRDIRNEFRPNRFDNVQRTRVPTVVIRKVHSRQRAVVADHRLETGAASRKHRVMQAAHIDEMLVAVNDRKVTVVRVPSRDIQCAP